MERVQYLESKAVMDVTIWRLLDGDSTEFPHGQVHRRVNLAVSATLPCPSVRCSVWHELHVSRMIQVTLPCMQLAPVNDLQTVTTLYICIEQRQSSGIRFSNNRYFLSCRAAQLQIQIEFQISTPSPDRRTFQMPEAVSGRLLAQGINDTSAYVLRGTGK
jgi:hypothetical protein